jgi:hypothetical protein
MGSDGPTANGASANTFPMSQSLSSGIVPSQSARIEVIGVGGGGSNAVNRMISSDLQGVGYRVLNTSRPPRTAPSWARSSPGVSGPVATR